MDCSAVLSECSSSSARAGISHVCQRSYEKENQQFLLLTQQRQKSQPVALLFSCRRFRVVRVWLDGDWSRTISSSFTGVEQRVIVGVEKYVLLSSLADVAPVNSSAVLFHWAIRPCRSVVVGISRKYDQVPPCG